MGWERGRGQDSCPIGKWAEEVRDIWESDLGRPPPPQGLWVRGAGLNASAYSPVSDAVALRVRSGILEQTGATAAVLQSDTMDHYRTFHMLERLLHAPPKLLHQLIFQIPPSRQALLIERWGPQPV